MKTYGVTIFDVTKDRFDISIVDSVFVKADSFQQAAELATSEFKNKIKELDSIQKVSFGFAPDEMVADSENYAICHVLDDNGKPSKFDLDFNLKKGFPSVAKVDTMLEDKGFKVIDEKTNESFWVTAHTKEVQDAYNNDSKGVFEVLANNDTDRFQVGERIRIKMMGKFKPVVFE